MFPMLQKASKAALPAYCLNRAVSSRQSIALTRVCRIHSKLETDCPGWLYYHVKQPKLERGQLAYARL